MNRIIQQMHANTPAQNTVAPSYSERQKVVLWNYKEDICKLFDSLDFNHFANWCSDDPGAVAVMEVVVWMHW